MKTNTHLKRFGIKLVQVTDGGSFHCWKIFLIPTNIFMPYKKTKQVCKVKHPFILDGGATVQNSQIKVDCTEWSLSPAIELLALCDIIIVAENI